MVTVQHGVARPALRLVGDETPRLEVPKQVDATALADSFNAILNGSGVTDEMTGFHVLLAAAFNQGVEHGRSLAEVA
jgi:hypothetical protein